MAQRTANVAPRWDTPFNAVMAASPCASESISTNAVLAPSAV